MYSFSLCSFFKFVIYIIIINSVLGDCGYNSCTKTDPKKLNIHIISHSHDDVGWVKTVDGLYEDDVEHVITNVVKSLDKNPNRKFTQVETYFFNRWWNEQNNETKLLVYRLINSGQLSFANGGYCVNDEAVAHYNNIIDQMTLGLKILNDLFGKCGHPLISWQIDPFGASKEMASLYAQMGFDGHVTNRAIDPKGEFIWRGSHELGDKSEIFTTVLHDHYSAPNGFNFENGNDITNENKKQKATEIVKLAQDWNTKYGNTGHVLMPFGDDFQYKNAERWFENIDKLINEITATHPEVNIFYSTPSCYISTVNKLNHTFSHRDNDYFPLWTGFYTSRPTLKYQDRVTNNIFQISKQLDAITRLVDSEPFLDEGRNELAILTHHDAITGTSPQWTADDYSQRLFNAFKASEEVINRAYNKLLPKDLNNKTIPKQIVCDLLNITECSVSENSSNFTLIIYNPIGRTISQWIQIPVISGFNYEIFDSNGNKVNKTFLIPVSQSVQRIPERKSMAKTELVFKPNIVGLGFDTYFIKKTTKISQIFNSNDNNVRHKRESDHQMKGKGFTLQLDNNSGNIKSIKLENGKVFPFKQTFKYYKSNSDTIYEFCPEGNVSDLKSIKLESKYDNGLVHEVRQQWDDWISQTIRVYEDEEYVEFDWIVGPIPINDIGKEVITVYETDLNNDKTFYSDALGRQMVKRVRTSETKNCFQSKNNISNNYYPIKSKIFMRDEKQNMQITVLTDRAQGGSSLTDGQLELMIHRRLLKALYIGLNETGVDGRGLVVRGKHYLFFKPINESAKLYKDLSQRLFMQPLITFSPLTQSESDYKNKFQTSYSALNQELPQNIHLLSLEQWKSNQILVRFEHFYESLDNNELSKAIELNLQKVFKPFNVLNVSEMTLTANQKLSEVNRMKWNSNKQLSESQSTHNRMIRENKDFTITLKPQEIRTFIITLEENKQTKEKCSLSWIKVTENKMPNNAIIGGLEKGNIPDYICRHSLNNVLIPGNAKNSSCFVTNAGKVFNYSTDYEILVGNNYDWIPRHGADPVPKHAFVAGNDEKGHPIYIGRFDLNSGSDHMRIIGKIQRKLYYPFGNIEKSESGNHHIMIC